MNSFNPSWLREQQGRLVSCGLPTLISSPEIFQSSISKPKNFFWFPIRRPSPYSLGTGLHCTLVHWFPVPLMGGSFFSILLNSGMPKGSTSAKIMRVKVRGVSSSGSSRSSSCPTLHDILPSAALKEHVANSSCSFIRGLSVRMVQNRSTNQRVVDRPQVAEIHWLVVIAAQPCFFLTDIAWPLLPTLSLEASLFLFLCRRIFPALDPS